MKIRLLITMTFDASRAGGFLSPLGYRPSFVTAVCRTAARYGEPVEDIGLMRRLDGLRACEGQRGNS